jgi:RNA polymerase sigma-70 factor (ECF subfamily)
MDIEHWERLPDRFGIDPADKAYSHELIEALRRAIDEELTDHQRHIFVAIVLNGVLLDTLVAELGTNRNAIYKTMFDARRKLRAALAASGYLDFASEIDSRRKL